MKNPRLSITTKTMLATVALSGLLAGAAARANTDSSSCTGSSCSMSAKGTPVADADASKHSCKGMNSCKGQGGCKTGDNGCKGKNDCKGKGGCKTNGTT